MEGNDNHELIFSFLLDGKGGAISCGWDEVEAWTPEKGTIWIHLSLPQDLKEGWINKHSNLSIL